MKIFNARNAESFNAKDAKTDFKDLGLLCALCV